MNHEKHIAEVVNAVWSGMARQAIKYVNEKFTIKATYHGKFDLRSRNDVIVVTLGTPNFKERRFIKLCKKAKEKFPIRKLQCVFRKKK